MGHGGGYIWADEGLMQLPDVDRLNNKGMYPFITSMTCFTGAFGK
ncbi:MAG: C25 family cysteine peptidase [Calditrichia bacterium]